MERRQIEGVAIDLVPKKCFKRCIFITIRRRCQKFQKVKLVHIINQEKNLPIGIDCDLLKFVFHFPFDFASETFEMTRTT